MTFPLRFRAVRDHHREPKREQIPKNVASYIDDRNPILFRVVHQPEVAGIRERILGSEILQKRPVVKCHIADSISLINDPAGAPDIDEQ